MVKAESEFKSELKRSLEAFLPGTPVWCPADKFTNGISDMQFVCQFFGAWELKNVVDLPKRDATNILKTPFTPKQMKYLIDVHSQPAGRGLGIIRLPADEAMLVYPGEMHTSLSDGNLSRQAAEELYRAKNVLRLIHRHRGGVWNIEPIFKADKDGRI